MSIDYRLARLEDLDEIVALVKNAVRTMEDNNIYQWDELYPIKEDFENDIQKGDLYTGFVDGQIAVIFALNQECDEEYKKADWIYSGEKYCIIHRLCVNPVYQNRGVAGATMQYIEEKLKAMGVLAIRLDVFSQNPYALRLYARSGYVKTGCADWRKGHFYLMEKCI